MPKFYLNCGTPVEGIKFCANCGSNLANQFDTRAITNFDNTVEERRAITTTTPGVESIRGFDNPNQSSDDLQSEPKALRYNINEIGKALEHMTNQILQRMGYKTELRQKLKDKTGVNHEIDVYATRGSKIKAVEYKNYADHRSVGMEDVRNFVQKLTDLKIPNGIFVTNVRFSGQAEQYATSKGLELWDGHELREKFFALTIGRLAPSDQASFEFAFPLQVEYVNAIARQLRNPDAVKASQCQLVFYPYFKVDYRVKAVRVDTTKGKHVVSDEGTYIVDGLDGEIINLEERMGSKVLGFLKNSSEDKAERTLQKWVTEDILTITPKAGYSVVQNRDFGISKIRLEINEESDAHSWRSSNPG